MSAPRFSDAMALQPVDGLPGDSARLFEANLNEHWTIGPKVHGGTMVALCANAARAGYADDGGSTVQPVAVSANFLSAPDPGAVRLRTTVRKRGRRIGLIDVELMQGDKTCVYAVVTMGEPERQALPLLANTPVVGLMGVEPPADVPVIGPRDPGAEISSLWHGCDMHATDLTDGSVPLPATWVRPKEGPVDELFALMCGDISLPVPYAVGRRGWCPTVQLTAFLRGRPAEGWLRVLCTTTQIGQDWFDEDHTVVDSAGRVIVQTHQLSLVPGQ
jgi:acyl-coenzyme A thioesterase PaaI-like protein